MNPTFDISVRRVKWELFEKIGLSGVTCVGKSSVIKELVDKHGFTFSVITTTRLPRPGEREEIDYFFVSKQDFEQMIEQKKLVEYTYYLGNYYGTHISQLEKQGKLVFDLDSYSDIKELMPEIVWVLFKHDDKEEIKRRLLNRDKGLCESIIQKRLQSIDEHDDKFNYDLTIDVTDKNAREITQELLSALVTNIR